MVRGVILEARGEGGEIKGKMDEIRVGLLDY